MVSSGSSLATSGNYADNIKHTLSNSSWAAEKTIYWNDEASKMDFYAYYPYSSSVSTSGFSFSVNTDQSTAEKYKTSELLWGCAKSVLPTENNGSVTISTKHSMSKANITVTLGDGFTSSTTYSVVLKDIKTTAVLNLSTGTTTLSETVADITPYKNGDGTFSALIPAQTIADGTPLIVITIDGKDYTLRSGCEFKQGYEHTVNVSVSKKSSGMNIGISNWETGGTISGEAE